MILAFGKTARSAQCISSLSPSIGDYTVLTSSALRAPGYPLPIGAPWPDGTPPPAILNEWQFVQMYRLCAPKLYHGFLWDSRLVTTSGVPPMYHISEQ